MLVFKAPHFTRSAIRMDRQDYLIFYHGCAMIFRFVRRKTYLSTIIKDKKPPLKYFLKSATCTLDKSWPLISMHTINYIDFGGNQRIPIYKDYFSIGVVNNFYLKMALCQILTIQWSSWALNYGFKPKLYQSSYFRSQNPYGFFLLQNVLTHWNGHIFLFWWLKHSKNFLVYCWLIIRD